MGKHQDAVEIHKGAYFQSGDPGAVGAGKQWIDTTSGPPFQLRVRNAGNSAWQTVGVVSGVTYGTPALTFGTSNTNGSTDEAIRRDAQLALFDATAPVTQAMGDTAAAGSAGVAARRDHKHGEPSFGGDGAATTPSRSDHTHGGGGGGGGAGFAHSYLGYNTIGGSTENITANRVYMKKVTISNAGIVTSIGVYMNQSTDNVQQVNVALMADAAGAPAHVLGYVMNKEQSLLLETAATPTYAPEWIHVPLGLYVPAADYWLAVMLNTGGTAQIYYDGSGSDRYYTSSGTWFSHAGRYSETDSTRKYSIRASLIS